MQLFNTTMQSLESALNASAARQHTISHNIANVDTPHYKAKEVIFKHELEKAMTLQARKTNASHIDFKHNQPTGDYAVRTKNQTTMNNHGNNVDIDREMALLAENQILYNALIERMNGKFNTIKTVAGGGR